MQIGLHIAKHVYNFFGWFVTLNVKTGHDIYERITYHNNKRFLFWQRWNAVFPVWSRWVARVEGMSIPILVNWGWLLMVSDVWSCFWSLKLVQDKCICIWCVIRHRAFTWRLKSGALVLSTFDIKIQLLIYNLWRPENIFGNACICTPSYEQNRSAILFLCLV